MNVFCTCDGDGAKKYQNEDIAKSHISEGFGASCIEDSRDDGGDSHKDERPATTVCEIDDDGYGERKGKDKSCAHGCGRNESGLCGACGADAFFGIGAIDKVEIVIGEVGSDLDEYGPEHGHACGQQVKGLVLICEGTAYENGGDGCGKGSK